MTELFPSHLRILIFVLFLGGLCLLDLPKPRNQRTRVHQYGYILYLGIVGAVFGLVNDSITSFYSPDYFVIAKGIPSGENFQLQVWWLGAQAGFAAFAFLGVVLMIMNPFKPNMQPIGQFLWQPIILAIVFAVGFSLLQSIGLFFRPMSPPISDPNLLDRFQIVWASHAGLYFGGVIGVLLMIVQLFSRSKQLT